MLFVNEDGTAATVNITLTNPLSTDLTLTINSMDGTATGKHLFSWRSVITSLCATGGGVDYDSGPYTVTFTAGQTSASFDVPINDDNIYERNETFSLAIDQSTLPNMVMLLPMCRLDVTIVDDDCKLLNNIHLLLLLYAHFPPLDHQYMCFSSKCCELANIVFNDDKLSLHT